MKRAILIAAPIAAAGAVAAVIAIEHAAAPRNADSLTRHDVMRRINRAVTNPLMRQVARLGFDYPAIVVAPGRTTGRIRETPIFAKRAGEDFLIPLPYGEGADWCLNVLAHGGCTLRFRNEPIAMTAPRVVDESAVSPWIDPRRLAIWRRWGIERFLHLQSATEGTPSQVAGQEAQR